MKSLLPRRYQTLLIAAVLIGLGIYESSTLAWCMGLFLIFIVALD